jgi:hypothetical protein
MWAGEARGEWCRWDDCGGPWSAAGRVRGADLLHISMWLPSRAPRNVKAPDLLTCPGRTGDGLFLVSSLDTTECALRSLARQALGSLARHGDWLGLVCRQAEVRFGGLVSHITNQVAGPVPPVPAVARNLLRLNTRGDSGGGAAAAGGAWANQRRETEAPRSTTPRGCRPRACTLPVGYGADGTRQPGNEQNIGYGGPANRLKEPPTQTKRTGLHGAPKERGFASIEL